MRGKKMFDIEFVGKFPFKKKMKDVITKEYVQYGDMNGVYIYETNKALVNVTSTDLLDIPTTAGKIRHLTEVCVHETVHHCIHEILGRTGLYGEEKVVELLAGQRKWRK